MCPDSIADLVDEQVVTVPRTVSAGEAIETLRTETPEHDRTVYYLYVTDGAKLVGVVSLRELLNADDDATVSDIMTVDVLTVSPDDTPDHVAEILTNNSLNTLPVVEDGSLRGIVRANDILDALDEQSAKEILRGTKRYSPFGD
ncbi:MAG: CBS domain-containing protein [Natronomonas sp.]